MEVTQSDDRIFLSLGERMIPLHTAERPFVTAVTETLRYQSSRGAFTVSRRKVRPIPLKNAVLHREADHRHLIFSGGGIALEAEMEEAERSLKLRFQQTEGMPCGFSFSLPASAEEAVFGGGEQFRQLNLKGERVTNFVSEHIKASALVHKLLVPKCLYRPKPQRKIGSYAPMSTFVFSTHMAVRFDVDGYGEQDFSAADVSRFYYAACPRAMTIFLENNFAEIGRALAKDIPNRQYLPAWCDTGMVLGVQGGFKRVMETAFRLQDAGAAVAAVWCQDWSGEKITAMGKQVYWNWEADPVLYPSFAENIRKLHARGIRFLAYINPYLVRGGPLYEECRARGYLICTRRGQISHVKSTTFEAGQIDLTNPDAAAFFKEQLIRRNMLDLGVDGYMADFGEYLPMDCAVYGGDSADYHNLWPVLWAKLNREAIDEHPRHDDLFFFTRSAYNGAQRYAPIMWNGDQHTDWTVDYGIPTVLPAAFSLGFSGITLSHADIGGFFSIGRIARDAELLIRSMEVGAFSPLMRSHESIRPDANAQPYDDAVIRHTVRLSRVHRALAPYLQRVAQEAREGIPAVRPDFYDAADYAKHKDPQSYFLGSELYVCPVYQKGAVQRRVWLPEGDWIHFWSKQPFSGGEHVVAAPLGSPPVFYRAGGLFSEMFSRLEPDYKD